MGLAVGFGPGAMSEADWSTLRQIFSGLKIMASSTSLVGNSKVMHHMLPNIVPPIDREYTLRYLYGATTIANDVDKEWRTMREIMSGFFTPVASDAAFAARADKWIALQRPWDTRARPGSGPHDHLALGPALRSRTRGAATPSSQANQ